MKVYLSELAEAKLLQLSDYLLENWGLQTRNRFIKKITDRINQISTQPESCPESDDFKGLYKCVVTKQTTLYYRILVELEEIEVITIFDTRKDPNTLKKDLE